jgi:AraC-like DNA-binding protein
MEYISTNVIDLLLLVGAIQGAILAIVLFFLKKNKLGSRILGILTLCWSLSTLWHTFQGTSFSTDFPHLLKIVSALPLMIYPLLYLYVKYFVSAAKRISKYDFLHFLPYIIRMLIYIPFYSMSAAEKLEIYRNPLLFYTVCDLMVNITIITQGIIYSILSYRIVKKFGANIQDNYSSIEKLVLDWLNVWIVLGLLSLLFGVIATIFFGKMNIYHDFFDVVFLIYVITIYVISYKTLLQPELFKYVREIDFKLPGKFNNKQPFTDQNNTDYEDTVVNDIYQKLSLYLEEEKPYLNPELKLRNLVDDLNFTRHQLSNVINTKFGKNFYELINDYRLKETIAKFDSNEFSNHTIESIAYSCGFNSKATFHRIFKKNMGTTPTSYLKTKIEVQN